MQIRRRVFPKDADGNSMIPRTCLPVDGKGKAILPKMEDENGNPLKKVIVDEAVDVRIELAAPPKQIQRFSRNWVEKAMAQGYLHAGGGLLTLRTPDDQEDVVYRITQPPGVYDGEKCNYFECQLEDAS